MKYTQDKFSARNPLLPLVFICAIAFALLSCSEPQPTPLVINTDNCAYCQMTISDPKFGAELLTKKGKTYKFDAIECMAGFYAEASVVKHEDIHSMWVINLISPGDLINAKNAVFVHCDQIKSPMGGDFSAVPTENDFNRVSTNYQCRRITWDDIVQASK